ncbi:MAG: FAD-binding oxidoreductase [Gammaproteobacteria bacterium]|nr:FAD-binding oxidoreductase [Gammaproteobacteria bacterium]
MKQSSDKGDSRRHSLPARQLRGSDALVARAAATRNLELRGVLRLAARRRLARVADVPAAAAHSPASAQAMPAAAGAPTLLKRVDVADDLLRLEISRPPGFDYVPGQHVKMGLRGVLRDYSLVSAPHQAYLEFFVELFPGGRLSEHLRTVTAGTAMALGSRAKGRLAVDERYRNQLLVGTVTGIAPYVSFVRHHLAQGADGQRRFIILHGASYAGELGYAEELTELARQHPETVVYVATVSRPESPENAGWGGAHGRVEDHLAGLISRLGLTPDDTAAFACGNPGMVRNVAQDCRRRGFATFTEAFD